MRTVSAALTPLVPVLLVPVLLVPILLSACRTVDPVPLADAVEIRAENFTVPPSTGPVTHVAVHNRGRTTRRGAVSLRVPDGWQLNASTHDVEIEPGATIRVPFAVEKAADRAANSYSVEATFASNGATLSRQQEVFCGSAPYGKPQIDGDLSDWADAIPVTFVSVDETSAAKKTVVRTLWSQRTFCLAVEVEEDRLIRHDPSVIGAPCDAIQFAIARRDAQTPDSDDDVVANRFEFLLVAVRPAERQPGGEHGDSRAWCCLLIEPGTPISMATQPIAVETAVISEGRVAVKRDGARTIWECSVPFSLLRRAVRPDVGRELRFSVLVHDPDGTGVRDLGHAAGLGATDRKPWAWCSWSGGEWGEKPPCDSKIEWGLCSSKH